VAQRSSSIGGHAADSRSKAARSNSAAYPSRKRAARRGALIASPTQFGNETVITDLYLGIGLELELLPQFACVDWVAALSDVADGGVVGTQLVLAAPSIEVIRLPAAGPVPERIAEPRSGPVEAGLDPCEVAPSAGCVTC
jgi:hypothetical protein